VTPPPTNPKKRRINGMKIFLLATATFIFVFAMVTESTSKETRSIEQILVDNASDYNRQLPAMVDSETRLDSLSAYKKTLYYKATLVNIRKSEFDYATVKKIKEPELINNLCTDNNTRTILNAGVNYVYSFYDKDGKKLIEFNIGKSMCHK